MQKRHFSMRKYTFAAKMSDEKKMRNHLHFAKEKADLSQNIWKINENYLSLRRKSIRFTIR